MHKLTQQREELLQKQQELSLLLKNQQTLNQEIN